MKVAIAGAGKVGRFLAEDLAQNGHEVQLLDSNADLVATLPPVEGVRYVDGGCLRGGLAARRPISTRWTSSSPPPATTRTTSSSPSSPSRSSPFPGCSHG